MQHFGMEQCRQYVGFDVGGWRTRSSHDAIARLTVEGESRSWNLLSRDEMGHRRRNVLHPENLDFVTDNLFNTLVPIPTHIAINAALGWPEDIRSLVSQKCPLPIPRSTESSISNRVLYRETDRFVVERGRGGVSSAVGEMYGNPSSKAQATAFLIREKHNGYLPPFDIWDRERFCKSDLVMFETMVDAVSKRSWVARTLKVEVATINKQLRALKQRALTPDEKKAVCCALIAESLVHAVCGDTTGAGGVFFLPDGDSSHDSTGRSLAPTERRTKVFSSPVDYSRVPKEGWAFVPM